MGLVSQWQPHEQKEGGMDMALVIKSTNLNTNIILNISYSGSYS